MILYTDGACSSKDKSGGWAVVLACGHEVNAAEAVVAVGSAADTTNNRMELKGVIAALRYAQENINNNNTEEVFIYTDSAYIVNCFKDKWYVKWRQNKWRNSSKQPVKNQDLWEQLLDLYETLQQHVCVTIDKVAGHQDNKYNNLADIYAVKARNQEV